MTTKSIKNLCDNDLSCVRPGNHIKATYIDKQGLEYVVEGVVWGGNKNHGPYNNYDTFFIGSAYVCIKSNAEDSNGKLLAYANNLIGVELIPKPWP